MVTIYGLWCDVTRKVYVGSTKNVPKRMREHYCLLRQGKHSERELQNDWFSFGASHFRVATFKRLESNVSVSERRVAELHWMDHWKDKGLLYNKRFIAFQPPEGAQAKAAALRVARGYRPSAESNLKRRLAQLGKPKNHGWKISATKQAKRLAGK